MCEYYICMQIWSLLSSINLSILLFSLYNISWIILAIIIYIISWLLFIIVTIIAIIVVVTIIYLPLLWCSLLGQKQMISLLGDGNPWSPVLSRVNLGHQKTEWTPKIRSEKWALSREYLWMVNKILFQLRIFCLSFSECFNGASWDYPPSGWSQLSCQLVLCPLHAGTFGFSIEMDGQRKIALVPERIEWKWSDASWPQEELSKNGKKTGASFAEERDSMNTMAAKMSETRRSRPSCSIWNSGSGGEIMA